MVGALLFNLRRYAKNGYMALVRYSLLYFSLKNKYGGYLKENYENYRFTLERYPYINKNFW